jgi:hypothetical protein
MYLQQTPPASKLTPSFSSAKEKQEEDVSLYWARLGWDFPLYIRLGATKNLLGSSEEIFVGSWR